MNRFEASLYRAFEKNGAGAPARRKAVLRTQQACARLVRERRMLVRTGSAAMFRQVARFSAPRLWAEMKDPDEPETGKSGETP